MQSPQITRSQAKGFTLIEIMVVIAIIMVLAAMTISGLSYVNEKAKINQTKVFISSVSQALEQYRADSGDYPPGNGEATSTQEVYDVLYGDSLTDNTATAYLDILDPTRQGNSKNVKGRGNIYVLVDAWKKENSTERQELFYRYPGTMNPPSDFDIWSVGPDHKGGPYGKKEDRKDDIKNW